MCYNKIYLVGTGLSPCSFLTLGGNIMFTIKLLDTEIESLYMSTLFDLESGESGSEGYVEYLDKTKSVFYLNQGGEKDFTVQNIKQVAGSYVSKEKFEKRLRAFLKID